MPLETTLWKLQDAALIATQRRSLQNESDLQSWIEKDPGLINSDLLLLGTEVGTAHGGRIDLLGVDSRGTVHVIELKRDKTPREVIAQALDYASWVVNLTSEDLQQIFAIHREDTLAAAFQQRFGEALPDTLNDEHSITIVASSLDASSERIVQYLSEYHGLNINAVFFTMFNDGASNFLSRSWLIDPQEVSERSEERAERKIRGAWTGYYFVNVGETKTEDRRWEDCRRFGFISAGQGVRYRNYMQLLEPRNKIFAYVNGRGYVGYGIVKASAVMARDFVLDDGQRLFDQQLAGTLIRQYQDDVDNAEYVVAVDWRDTVDIDHAKKYPGIFAIQQVVCKIYNAETVEYLNQQFPTSRSAQA